MISDMKREYIWQMTVKTVQYYFIITLIDPDQWEEYEYPLKK
jgi:hypothetical protein